MYLLIIFWVTLSCDMYVIALIYLKPYLFKLTKYGMKISLMHKSCAKRLCIGYKNVMYLTKRYAFFAGIKFEKILHEVI
jgi:hypothetical protein